MKKNPTDTAIENIADENNVSEDMTAASEEAVIENVPEKKPDAPKKKKIPLKKISPQKAIVFIVAAGAVLGLNAKLMSSFTITGKKVSVITVLIIIAVCLLGFLFRDMFENKLLRRFLKGTAAAALIAFGAETLIFNFNSLARNNEPLGITDIENIYSYDSYATVWQEKVYIYGNCDVYADIEKPDINAVSMEFEGSGESRFTCNVAITDDNFSREYYQVNERSANIDCKRLEFGFSSYGTLHSVKLHFEDVNEPIVINSVKFSKAPPFRFNELRFYLLFGLITLIWAIAVFELYKIEYDRKKKQHRLIIFAFTVLCSLILVLFGDPYQWDTEYDPNADLSWENPYVQMFDAFQKGQTNIDYPASQELLELENPYDYSVRSEKGMWFLWDRAYYNGKYYSYYGIAPLVTYFYPHYFITNKIPSLNEACMVFGMLAVISMFGVIMSFIKRFLNKPRFILVLMMLGGALFASGVLINVDFSDMYALPGVTGTAYLMLCLWTGFEACYNKNKKCQPFLFAVSGIAFALCLASKPTRALSCLILAPLFLEILFCKDMKAGKKVLSVAAFMIPVIAGCSGVMYYNYIRFDSPFQFGAVYQLTVSNINAGGLKASLIPDSIFQYFFKPFEATGIFPFIKTSYTWFPNSVGYIYSDNSAGAFTAPVILSGIIILPFILHHLRRKKGEKFTFNNVNIRKATYILMIAMALFIAWFSYCVAGIIRSYVCDILPLLSLLSVFVILDTQQQLEGSHEVAGKSVCLFSMASAATMLIMTAELLSNRDLALDHSLPQLFYILERIFVFWC